MANLLCQPFHSLEVKNLLHSYPTVWVLFPQILPRLAPFLPSQSVFKRHLFFRNNCPVPPITGAFLSPLPLSSFKVLIANCISLKYLAYRLFPPPKCKLPESGARLFDPLFSLYTNFGTERQAMGKLMLIQESEWPKVIRQLGRSRRCSQAVPRAGDGKGAGKAGEAPGCTYEAEGLRGKSRESGSGLQACFPWPRVGWMAGWAEGHKPLSD